MAKTSTKFFRLYRSYWRTGIISEIAKQGNSDNTLVALYLLSSSRGNMAGIYEIHKETIAKELGLPLNAVSASLEALEAAEFIKYDHELSYVWATHAVLMEFSAGVNEKQLKGVENLIDRLEFDECAPFANELRELISNHFNRSRKESSAVVDLRAELDRKKAQGML